MTTPTSIRNVKIKDNLITTGSSSTGSTPIVYTYTSNMSLGADAVIYGNTFSGCFGNGISSTNLISITSGSSIITNNNFIRGVGSPIAVYIAATSATDQTITNNLFDQTTVDGTIDVLTSGLSDGSIFHSNKNQVIYIPIQLGTGTYTDPSNIRYYTTANSSVANNLIYFESSIFTTASQYAVVNYILNDILPSGIRVAEMKIGLTAVVGAAAVLSATPSDNQFNMGITSVNNASANYTAGVNSLLDVKAQIALTDGGDLPVDFGLDTTYDIHGNITAMQAATQYITLSFANDERFRNTKDRMLGFSFIHYMKLLTAGNGIVFRFSPILAKCIW